MSEKNKKSDTFGSAITYGFLSGCNANARRDVGPRTLVLRFLLHPKDLCIAVLLDLLLDQIKRKRGKLLDSGDGYVGLFVAKESVAVLLQFIVNLSGAEDQPLDLAILHQLLSGIWTNGNGSADQKEGRGKRERKTNRE